MKFQNTLAFRKALLLASAVIFMLFLPACRSYHKNAQGINAAFYKNDLQKASDDLAAQQRGIAQCDVGAATSVWRHAVDGVAQERDAAGLPWADRREVRMGSRESVLGSVMRTSSR